MFRGTIPGGTPARPLLPSVVTFNASNNLLTGSLPEGLRHSVVFRDALQNTSKAFADFGGVAALPQAVLSLRKNLLNGRIPDFFFEAAIARARVDIHLGVRPF